MILDSHPILFNYVSMCKLTNLFLLQQHFVNIAVVDSTEIETGRIWVKTLCDAGTEFVEEEEGALWLFDNSWVFDTDYTWTSK